MKQSLIPVVICISLLGNSGSTEEPKKHPGLDIRGSSISNEDVVSWIYARCLEHSDYSTVSARTKDPKLISFVEVAGMDSLILIAVLNGDVDVNQLTYEGNGLSIAQMCAKKSRYSLLVAIAGTTKLDFSNKNKQNRLALLHYILFKSPSLEYLKTLTKHIQDKCEIVSPYHQSLNKLIEANLSLSSEEKKEAKQILKNLVDQGLVIEEILPPQSN
ncbi:MAG: hypothetical protein KDA70_06110 [Planctomycetaceae bacterium]|nr:hypothetical protein [Planctomycetaceae bacterium]